MDESVSFRKSASFIFVVKSNPFRLGISIFFLLVALLLILTKIEKAIYFSFILLLLSIMHTYHIFFSKLVSVSSEGVVSIPAKRQIENYMLDKYLIGYPSRFNESLGPLFFKFYFKKDNIKTVSKVSEAKELTYIKERRNLAQPNVEDLERFYVTNPQKTVCIEFKKPLELMREDETINYKFFKIEKNKPSVKKIYISVNNPEEVVKSLKN